MSDQQQPSQAQAPGQQPASQTTGDFGLTPENSRLFETKGWLKDGKPDFNAAATGFYQLEKLVGSDKVPLPPKGQDGQRDWSQWEGWSHLGVPEKPDGYQIKVPDGYDLTDTDKAFHQHMLPLAHKAKLAPWQMDILAEGFNDFSGNLRGQNAGRIGQEVEAAEAVLQKKFGPALDQKLDLANRAAEHFFGQDLLVAINAAGLGRNPAFVEKMIALGELTAEDNRLPGAATLPAADPEAEVKKLEGDKDFVAAYLDGSHPGHKEAVRRMNDALAKASAGRGGRR